LGLHPIQNPGIFAMQEAIMKKSKPTRKQDFADQLPKRQYESSLRESVDKYNIRKIVSRLHKINFSGRYNYPELNEKIGPFFDDTKNNWMRKSYAKKYVRKFPNFNVSVFVNPIEIRPPCYLQITPMKDITIATYKEFLIQLATWFPDLQTSRVEYACDIFYTPDAISITDFYDNIRRHLYVPYQKEVRTLGGITEKIGKNIVTHFGGDHKAYERGADILKNSDDYWMETDLDRVRLEYTADKKFLRKNGISSLFDLIKNPKFFKININRWRFQQFKESAKGLPSPWQPFTAQDKDEFSGSFQSEYLKAKEDGIVKNPAQAKEDVPAFFAIVYDMALSMSRFDDLWAST
jgi:hypothetical protein